MENQENNDFQMVTDETPSAPPPTEIPAVNKIDPCPKPIEESSKTNNALALLCQYSGSESDEDENQITDDVYRKQDSSSSDSSSSSSNDSEEEKDLKVIEKKIKETVAVSDGDSDDEDTNKKKKREPLKVKGELTIDDLPPIQDLQITIDERECMEIGVITTIVDQLVLVESLPNSVPLDIDSVLFLDQGKLALGKVFDVIGPVSTPIYCVRFNNHDDIVAKGIAVGHKVFFAPRTEYAQFVILSNIMTKGSDASWKNDIEPPENLVEYSDDENERKNKKKGKANRNNSQPGEQREFVRGQRYMVGPQGQLGQGQNQQNRNQNFGHGHNQQPPNLAYPNFSWHMNIPPPPSNQFQHTYNYYQQN